jgi:methyl-accepting chemotaxis protein
MVEFTENLIKKMVLITMVVFFIFSFVFFSIFVRNQQQTETNQMARYSVNAISQMFSQKEINLLIEESYNFEKKFYLEKINIILKKISYELNLSDKDVFIAKKERKQYLKVFMIDKAPNPKGIKKIKNINSYTFKQFKNKDNENIDYYIFIKINNKRKKVFFSSLFFSTVILLIFLLSFILIKKLFRKDFAFYQKIEELLDKKENKNMLMIKEDDFTFVKQIKELLNGLYLIKKRIYKNIDSLKEINQKKVVSMLNNLQEEMIEQKNKEEEVDFYLKKIEKIEEENKELIKNLEIKNSREKIEELLTGIKTINNNILKMETDLSSINSRFLKTMEYIISLEELAERSHLLSINATIEATSENENKRFSVVASEIRKLSKESKEITNKIKTDFSQLKELIGEKSAEDIKNTKEIMAELITFDEFFNKYFEKQINIKENIKANANDSGLISQKVLTSLSLILKNIPKQEKIVKEIFTYLDQYMKNYEIFKSNIEQTKKMIDGVLKNEKK